MSKAWEKPVSTRELHHTRLFSGTKYFAQSEGSLGASVCLRVRVKATKTGPELLAKPPNSRQPGLVEGPGIPWPLLRPADALRDAYVPSC